MYTRICVTMCLLILSWYVKKEDWMFRIYNSDLSTTFLNLTHCINSQGRNKCGLRHGGINLLLGYGSDLVVLSSGGQPPQWEP